VGSEFGAGIGRVDSGEDGDDLSTDGSAASSGIFFLSIALLLYYQVKTLVFNCAIAIPTLRGEHFSELVSA
jgi:hypothetical protein